MATARFSFTFDWPMNSHKRWGRSFSSKDESSSTGAAETTRSLRSGFALAEATGRIVTRALKVQTDAVDRDGIAEFSPHFLHSLHWGEDCPVRLNCPAGLTHARHARRRTVS